MLMQGIERIKKFLHNGSLVYIYGTGLWGRNVYQALKEQEVPVRGFAVTKKSEGELFGLPVYEFSEIEHQNGIGGGIVLVLGLNQHNTKEVHEYLLKHHFDSERLFFVNDVMGNNDVRCGYDETPCIDITTRIGCSVNCRYCPQDVFLKQYYKDDTDRKSLMSMETLMKCVEHMPQNTAFQFGGFVEPFLNPDCAELIRVVCEAGRSVNLYTTLVGLNEETLQLVMDLPIDYVTLHVADAKGYANISLTEEYYRLVELAVNHKKKDGRPFVGMCNAQAEPDGRVAEICREKYLISNTLLDRAGNLEGENLVSKRVSTGKISCGVCGSGLNKNELLPDGTLLLCCMDYGMKHVLGNLEQQSYEEITGGKEMMYIKEGMESDFSKDILCRKCSCANLV